MLGPPVRGSRGEFPLRRETLTIVDQRGPSDSHRAQMSSFRFYQDRETGNVVLFLARYYRVEVT